MSSTYCLYQPVATPTDYNGAKYACEFYPNADAQAAQPYKPEIYAMMEALSPDGGPGESTTETASAYIVLFIQYRIK